MPGKDHKKEKFELKYDENHKIPLYPEMLLKVFSLCWVKAGIDPGKKGAVSRLGRLLRDKYHIDEYEPDRYPNFLKKILWEAQEALKDNTLKYKEQGRHSNRLLPLLHYAGIENDYEAMNRKFRRSSARFAFISKPFSIFNFLRLTHEAHLIAENNTWSFKYGRRIYAGGTIEKIEPYTMPGDRTPRWLEVTYTLEGQSHRGFFAEYEGAKLKTQDDTTLLYSFFNSLP